MSAKVPARALSLRFQLLVACMVPVLVMVGYAGVSRRALDESVATTAWVVRTNETIANVNALSNIVVDAETGQRGFLVTRDPVFLEPFESAIPRFWKKLAELQQQVENNPQQLARLAEIESEFADWRREIALPSIRDGAADVDRERSGKARIDHIRRVVDEFAMTEHALLRSRTEESERAVERNRLISTSGALLSVVIALTVALYLATSVARSITELASAARDIANGDRTRRADVRRADEIGALASSFNTMAARIEAQTNQSRLLADLGEELRACLTLDEASAAFVRFVGRAWPEASGAMFLTSPSRDVVVRQFSWGEPPGAEAVSPESCWALRKGRLHVLNHATDGARCEHTIADPGASSVCIPLVAQAETIGILHVTGAAGAFDEARAELVQQVAEQLGQSVASLQLQERLRSQSIRDQLTGLFNRRYMEETLPRELSRADRGKQALAVMVLDVDHFKRFNDTFGHDAGDVVLRELANVLRASVRGSDIAVRLGGEEFVVVLPGVRTEQAERRAERLRAAVSALSLSYRDSSLGKVTISIGVAVFPLSGRRAEDLLRAADAALYRAKGEGRDRVAFATAPTSSPVLTPSAPAPPPDDRA